MLTHGGSESVTGGCNLVASRRQVEWSLTIVATRTA